MAEYHWVIARCKMDLGGYGAWAGPQIDDERRVKYAVEAEKIAYGTV
jgi:hypothetical protein